MKGAVARLKWIDSKSMDLSLQCRHNLASWLSIRELEQGRGVSRGGVSG